MTLKVFTGGRISAAANLGQELHFEPYYSWLIADALSGRCCTVSHRNRLKRQLFLPQSLSREDIWKGLGSSKVVHRTYGFEMWKYFLNLKKIIFFYIMFFYKWVNNWIIVLLANFKWDFFCNYLNQSKRAKFNLTLVTALSLAVKTHLRNSQKNQGNTHYSGYSYESDISLRVSCF